MYAGLMRKRVLAGMLCAGVVAGAVVVASSSAGGGGAGQTRHYTGVFYVDQTSFARVAVTNLTNSPQDVTVSFKNIGVDDSETHEVPARGYFDGFLSNTCQAAACAGRAEVRTATPLIAPTLRYADADGERRHIVPGDFVVVRDGKRIP